jgi:hypothetical protein
MYKVFLSLTPYDLTVGSKRRGKSEAGRTNVSKNLEIMKYSSLKCLLMFKDFGFFYLHGYRLSIKSR